MGSQLKILIIDDSIDDTELILLELRRAGFSAEWKRVCTETGMREALERESWDVVLSDHNMPSFSSSAALEIFMEYKLDIPFIIVSGKIGEENAVEAMKAGCYDYVMKDKLSRLGPIIHKGMQEARVKYEHRLAEEKVRESERWLFTTLRSIGEAVITTDSNGYMKFMNTAAEKLLGFSQHEVTGKSMESFFQLVSEKNEEKLENPVVRVVRDGKMFSVLNDTLLVTSEGKLIPIDYNAAPIKNDNGQAIGSVLVFRDITERRSAEKVIRQSLFDLTESISRTIEFRDPYTAGHQKRVALLAKQVGEKMKLSEEKINELYIGGLLHDIGKVGIPIDILSKPTKLSELEFRFIKEHPQTGNEIIKDAKLPWNIANIVLHHHEKLDGSGYPYGISGDQISMEVRIITVCDIVEAMSTFRPYRPALPMEEVLKELRGGRGAKYDAEVVDIAIELLVSGSFNPWSK